jgi:D-3-phosphoglycerate dehydrogenase
VNTSRGAVIDEPALIAALKAHAIAGAGLDVFDPQPPVADNPLLQMDNVVLTPHSASDTVERWSRTARFVWRNVALVRDGGTPVL